MSARQTSPLKVDQETDMRISQGAHFLGITKKDLVADAVDMYLESRRDQIRRGVINAMKALDGSLKSDVVLLTGLSEAEIDELGGTDE